MFCFLPLLLAVPIFASDPMANGSESVLHRFQGGWDGSGPRAGLIADSAGYLFGTTFDAGSPAGAGVVYELQPPSVPSIGGAWTEAVLHTFHGHGDGLIPYGSVVFGIGGLLYGATEFGGKSACSSGFGCGTVFAVSP